MYVVGIPRRPEHLPSGHRSFAPSAAAAGSAAQQQSGKDFVFRWFSLFWAVAAGRPFEKCESNMCEYVMRSTTLPRTTNTEIIYAVRIANLASSPDSPACCSPTGDDAASSRIAALPLLIRDSWIQRRSSPLGEDPPGRIVGRAARSGRRLAFIVALAPRSMSLPAAAAPERNERRRDCRKQAPENGIVANEST
jgi:hypothetical protein